MAEFGLCLVLILELDFLAGTVRLLCGVPGVTRPGM